MAPLALVLVALCGASTGGTFSSQEVDVVLAGMRALGIRQCVLASEGISQRAVKKFNRNFILTAIVGNLGVYLRRVTPPDALTAIVMKSQPPEALTQNYDRMFWFTWFLITDEDLDERIRIPFNCQFFIVKRGGNGEYRLVEKYHIKRSPTFSNDFAIWMPGIGLNVTSLNFYQRRRDMKGAELVRTDKGVHRCNRYRLESEIQRLWVDAANLLNFSLRAVEQHLDSGHHPDGSSCIWGITDLDSKKDWVFLNFGISVRLVTKFRSSNEVGWKAYVKPFKTEMWAALGLWLFLATAAIVIVNGCTKATFYRNVFTAFYCLCNSDPMATHSPLEAISSSIKFVYLMTLVVPAVLVPAYSAYILSTLSIVLPLEPFHDLKSFIADGTFKVSAVHNTFAIRYFQKSEDPDIKHIKDHLFVGVDNVAPTFPDLFDQICKDHHLAGLFVDTKAFRSLFNCRMFVMKQEVISITTGFLLQKNSPFRKLFNELFAMYHEKGMVYTPSVMRQGSPSDVDNFGEEAVQLSSLNLSQMCWLFFLIPFGVLLSGIILAVEIAFERKFKVSSNPR